MSVEGNMRDTHMLILRQGRQAGQVQAAHMLPRSREGSLVLLLQPLGDIALGRRQGLPVRVPRSHRVGAQRQQRLFWQTHSPLQCAWPAATAAARRASSACFGST